MSLNHHPPTPDATVLRAQFVGKSLHDVDPPAAVIDLALVKKNCTAMLESAKQMGVLFRAHVKTHKTVEITRLQVGEEGPVRLIASTLVEIEFLVPYMVDCLGKGRDVDILYGMPTPPSTISRLVDVAKSLATNAKSGTTGSVTLLIDSVGGMRAVRNRLRDVTDVQFNIMVKVDTGYHRAGIPTQSDSGSYFHAVLDQIKETESENKCIRFTGFYCHRGDSYSGSSPDDALDYLQNEVEGLASAAEIAQQKGWDGRLSLSLGATPQVTTLQYILGTSTSRTTKLRELSAKTNESHDLEVHAGVYATLDLQQVATHARPTTVDGSSTAVLPLNTSHIALRVLVEAASVYDDRVVLAAGTLALGREPCKSYPGWAIVTTWRSRATSDETTSKDKLSITYDESSNAGWIVDKISQEHGILGWHGETPIPKDCELEVGDKLMVWPNHACVAGACFGYFLVVDSDRPDQDEIVDVWVRPRGW